jgi:hypothetical protein
MTAHLSVTVPRDCFDGTGQISQAVAGLLAAGYLVTVSSVGWLRFDEFEEALRQRGAGQVYLRALFEIRDGARCSAQVWASGSRYHPEVPPSGFSIFLDLTASRGAATVRMYSYFTKDLKIWKRKERQVRTDVVRIIEESLGKRIRWEIAPPPPFLR